MSVTKITKNNFEQEILAAKEPVLIIFWSEENEISKKQLEILQKMDEDSLDEIKFTQINVDDNPGLALNYQIMDVPVVILMKYGIFQKRKNSFLDETQIVDFIKNN